MDKYSIGIDVHPILGATAANQSLAAIWVDPSGPNGESQFNCNSFPGCNTAGIVNIQSLEQKGYAIFQGDIVGMQNGSLGASVGYLNPSPWFVLGVGNASGTVPETWDVGSPGVNSQLVGLEVVPTFMNTALGTAGRNTDYAADFRVKSISAYPNILERQIAVHVQNGVTDGNTTVHNNYGIYIEPMLGGTQGNYGIYNRSSMYTAGNSDAGSRSTAGVMGVSCTGAPTSSFSSTNGIVTHC